MVEAMITWGKWRARASIVGDHRIMRCYILCANPSTSRLATAGRYGWQLLLV